jgi:lysophospholipase L1-like esterase
MKGFFKFIKDAWLIAGITFLFLLLIEIGFTVYFRFNPQNDNQPIADSYQGADWLEDYNKEFDECSAEDWHPYVYWRRKPYTGKYININEKGLRKTIYPTDEFVKKEPLKKVFMFGGSTMWGSGVRDEFTLPSLVGSGLAKQGIHAEVTNFGESGYVSTQEMLELFLQLREGNIPGLVVFYDGANDVFSAYQQGKAGIPQNEDNRVKEFNSLRSKKRSLMVFFTSLKTLSTVKFISNLIQPAIEPLPYSDSDIQRLAVETTGVYLKNIETTDLWATEYGFKVIYYWQPTIFSKSALTGFEKQEAEKFSFVKTIVEAANHKAENLKTNPSLSVFYNISDIFLNESKPVFIDYCHVSEYGNSVIAERMTKDISELIEPK